MPPWILPAVEMFLKFGLPAAEKFIATWHRKGASKEDWLNLLREVDAMDYDKTIAAAQKRLDASDSGVATVKGPFVGTAAGTAFPTITVRG